MHAHLDREHCLETVILHGPAVGVRRFTDALCAQRGVHDGKLNLISVDLHGAHQHAAAPDQLPHVHVKPAKPAFSLAARVLSHRCASFRA